MADVLSKKRRLDKQLSLDGDAEAREEASKDGVTLLHARNRGLATNLYVYKRKISTLNVALERASRSRVQLEEVVSVFNRRLGHLESDITNLLTQLAAQQKRDSGEPLRSSPRRSCCLQPRGASRRQAVPSVTLQHHLDIPSWTRPCTSHQPLQLQAMRSPCQKIQPFRRLR